MWGMAAAAALAAIGLIWILPALRKGTDPVIDPDITAVSSITPRTEEDPDTKKETPAAFLEGALYKYGQENTQYLLKTNDSVYVLNNPSAGIKETLDGIWSTSPIKVGYDGTVLETYPAQIYPETVEKQITDVFVLEIDFLRDMAELGYHDFIYEVQSYRPVLVMRIPDFWQGNFPYAIDYSDMSQPYVSTTGDSVTIVDLDYGDVSGENRGLPLVKFTLKSEKNAKDNGFDLDPLCPMYARKLWKEYRFGEDVNRYLCIEYIPYGLYYLLGYQTIVLAVDEDGTITDSVSLTDEELLTLAEIQSGMTAEELNETRERFQKTKEARGMQDPGMEAEFLSDYCGRLLEAEVFLEVIGVSGAEEFYWVD